MPSAVTTDLEQRQDIAKTSRALIFLFTTAVFWAAVLLFVLEPMFAKMILPVFGGSPAVWNTSMVFFQSGLFLAYIYSHYVAQRKPAQSVLIHSIAIFTPLLVLPISIRAASNLNTVVNHPTAAVWMIAVSSIGLPFFIVATSSPLLQRWFSQTAHREASDPYFLYAASNAGSLIGLALYPCILEPKFRIAQQSTIWSMGYVVFLVLVVACGVAGYRWRTPSPLPIAREVGATPQPTDKPLWVALAFVPASLLYAFTAQLSVDFPPVPLLWVIPLGLYLLTFIVAFSTPFDWLRRAGRVLPSIIVAAMVVFLLGFNTRHGWWGALGVLKLCCFVVIALAFHTELARRRPARQHLTEYYLWVSAGGILGGLLNSFVAPVVFSDFWEYPLTLIVAAALLPTISVVSRRPVNLKIIGVAIAVTSIVGIAMRMSNSPSSSAIRIAALVAGAILCMRVPLKWTAMALLLVSLSIGWVYPLHPLFQRRSFFGRYQITTADEGKWRILLHGTTIHGIQRVGDSPLHSAPAGYYLPVKTAFDLALVHKPSANIAVVGLGAGIIACYSRPEQSTTFFEIDPLVERIASRYFSFLSQCAGRKKVTLGDARLTIGNAAPHSFDVIVLDAFSSDSIPVHLLTKEAFDLYREKLTADGLILVHISNLYLDLAPVVAGSGAQTGYSTLLLDDTRVTPKEAEQGRYPSRWAVILPSDLEEEFEANGWKPFTDPRLVWTDDHSSIFSVMRWQNFFGTESFERWAKDRK